MAPQVTWKAQDEALGLDAWSDMDRIVGFLAGFLEGRGAESLGEDDREDLEDALERMAQRRPFLQTTFYRRPVNKAFRAGRHLQMMYQLASRRVAMVWRKR